MGGAERVAPALCSICGKRALTMVIDYRQRRPVTPDFPRIGFCREHRAEAVKLSRAVGYK